MNFIMRWVYNAGRSTIAFAMLAGCSPPPLEGPPDIRLGRAECAECGMLISEDRCSSALLIERDRHREYLNYDDLGCMLDDEQEALEGSIVIDRFVRDYGTRAWLRAEDATFLFTQDSSMHTPMGSGMVAFATKTAAEAALTNGAGTLHDYRSLQVARREWMASRYGRAKPQVEGN